MSQIQQYPLHTCQVSRISRETHTFCPQKASHARRGVKEHVSHSFELSGHISASTWSTTKYDLSTHVKILRGSYSWTPKYDLDKAYQSEIDVHYVLVIKASSTHLHSNFHLTLIRICGVRADPAKF